MNKEYYIKLKAKLTEESKTVRDLNKQVKKMGNKIEKLEIKVKTPTSLKAFGDLDKQLKKLKVNMSDFQDNVISTTSSMNNVTTKYTDNAGKVLTIQQKMIDGEKKYKVTLKDVSDAIDTNAKQADKWNYSWSKAFQSFTTYMSVATVFYKMINTIKDMVNNVHSLDDSLVELQKVTNLEGDSLARFTDEAFAAGETVAKSGKDMIDAATSFAKAGYSEEQILQLGKVATVYTNIADEEISAADAASFLIAQLKAFGLESEDINETLKNSYHVIDAVNNVSNNFAVSSADLATSIGKVSSTMAAGNTTFEQTLGMITAIATITRDAGKAANGLKTIAQRIRGVGEDGEDASEYVASLQEQFDKLGIEVKIIKNSAGDMESAYNILKGMAEKWNDLTDAERQSLGELAAG